MPTCNWCGRECDSLVSGACSMKCWQEAQNAGVNLTPAKPLPCGTGCIAMLAAGAVFGGAGYWFGGQIWMWIMGIAGIALMAKMLPRS